MTDVAIDQNLNTALNDLSQVLNQLDGIETITNPAVFQNDRVCVIYIKPFQNSEGSRILSRCLSGRYHNYGEGEQRADPVWTLSLGDTERDPIFELSARDKVNNISVLHAVKKLTKNIQHYQESKQFAKSPSHHFCAKFKVGDPITVLGKEAYVRYVTFTSSKVRYGVTLCEEQSTLHNIDGCLVEPRDGEPTLLGPDNLS